MKLLHLYTFCNVVHICSLLPKSFDWLDVWVLNPKTPVDYNKATKISAKAKSVKYRNSNPE